MDVRPAKDAAKDKPAATATYRTFDGLVLAIEGYAEGDKRYVRVKPSVDETAARRFFVAAAAPAGKDGAADVGSAKAARSRRRPGAEIRPGHESRERGRADARGGHEARDASYRLVVRDS